MTIPLKRIESHPHEAKRLIGIEYAQFLALAVLSQPKHIQKKAEMGKDKIRIIAKVGRRKNSLLPKEGVCFYKRVFEAKTNFSNVRFGI